MKNLFMPVKAIYSTFTTGIEMFEKKNDKKQFSLHLHMLSTSLDGKLNQNLRKANPNFKKKSMYVHIYSNVITPSQARSTPKNCGPPRPPVKSAPPVSRIFPHRPIERAQVVSFRSDEGSRCILYLYEQKLRMLYHYGSDLSSCSAYVQNTS